MKITYNKNPLLTTVELDEHEKKELWYRIKIKEMEELLYSAHFHLQEGKFYDVNRAKESVKADYYCTDDKSDLDKRCDELFGYFIEELMGKHAGDCTCIACTCDKCYAESLLGIDTIKGLGKHSASKIDAAFGINNEKTLDEAIESLAHYEPVRSASWEKYPQADFDKHVSRWKQEAKVAHAWLVQYKADHFPDVT